MEFPWSYEGWNSIKRTFSQVFPLDEAPLDGDEDPEDSALPEKSQKTLSPGPASVASLDGEEEENESGAAGGDDEDEDSLSTLSKKRYAKKKPPPSQLPEAFRPIEGAPHSFYKKTFAAPTYCNFCHQFIWGLAESGYCCEVCSYALHSACFKANFPDAVPLSCRITNLPEVFFGNAQNITNPHISSTTTTTSCNSSSSSVGGVVREGVSNMSIVTNSTSVLHLSSASRNAVNVFSCHHWLDGAAVTANCNVCRKPLSVDVAASCVRCSRCLFQAHSSCLLSIPMPRCEPPLKKLLYYGNAPTEEEHTPVVVFINSKSGGQQGEVLIRKLRRLLGPNQVVDLKRTKPEIAMERFSAAVPVRVVACGGDGTVAWILQALDKVGRRWPVGVLPLGTGNDLSRTLGWGPGYEGENLVQLLTDVEHATQVELDRWEVQCAIENPSGGGVKAAAPRIMNNYFSIGVDAKVAYEFHTQREQQPELFTSRMGNKLWYALNGVKAMFETSDRSLSASIQLEVDGKVVEVPAGIEGIIVMNVTSYAGGADLWGPLEEPSPFRAPALSDGLLEVVGITGTLHMGTITANLGSALRIAQAAKIVIRVLSNKPIAMQVDGEPWMQAPCVISCSHYNRVRMLANDHKRAVSAGGVAAEQSIATSLLAQLFEDPADGSVAEEEEEEEEGFPTKAHHHSSEAEDADEDVGSNVAVFGDG